VLGAVAVMMFALGSSMLGLFRINVHHSLLNRLHSLRKLEYVGLLLSGMLVGVFAAPCIGPPVIALLTAVANNGDPKFGFLAFFIFSLGMGLPYLILGTFENLLIKLPKAGKWLIWVERLFGVILIGFGIFYLALALHWQLPKPGRVEIWQPYIEEKFQKDIAVRNPVVIDFFADWCLGCHELDINVFSKPEIQAKLKLVTTLRVDATNMDDPLVQGLLEKYELIGLPTVIFLDRDGQEVKEARVEGSVSLEEFTQSLETWAQKAEIKFQETP
jgi:thiol:disulfide interchange protein DsbD